MRSARGWPSSAEAAGHDREPVQVRRLPRVAATFLGFVAVCVAAGCGGSLPAMPPAQYLPPLRVSPRSLAVKPASARAAKQTLRTIADSLRPPRAIRDRRVQFAYVVFRMIVVNPGSSQGYALSQTLADRLTVMPDSSATIREQVLTSPTFLSKTDRKEWKATGEQPYASPSNHAGESRRESLPPGGWSFTPQGIKLTYAGVRHLPAARPALARDLARLLGARGHALPPAGLSLRQYGFLLAAAPLTRPVRVALLESIGNLPGIHVCGDLFPSRGPHDGAFCVNGDPMGTGILLNPHTGVVDLVCERLDDLTPLFPRVPVGTLVDSFAFSVEAPA